MPYSVNLAKAFTDGELFVTPVETPASGTANFLKPAIGEAWLVLYGIVKHVTGTDTVILFMKKRNASSTEFALQEQMVLKTIPALAAAANGIYPLFNTQAAVTNALKPEFLVMSDQMSVGLAGDSGARFRLTVLRWRP